MKILPHIIVSYPDNFPSEFKQKAEQELSFKGLNVLIKENQPEKYACIEWAIPGLIVAFITKSYFESFLKEAGKDHYIILKSWLKKLIIDSRKHKVVVLTSTFSIHKIDKSNTQSRAISIFLETPDHKRIKLLFDESLRYEIWTNSLENILNSVNHAYNTSSINYIWNNTLSDNEGSMIYAIIDKDTNQWIFLNDKDLIRIHYEQQTTK